ncbi:matrixin family metalloprotease [Actinophytocola xanthii]|uniref:Peptidase M10 metallopeptidase domain-containing protein n=1 Tax=Actinophytocola xanthii TaxID=1912961 RepID=A0A1Q8CXD1_9PSEU|nr:matrixin family metalloprotease [Actinophytocola xanthii]OLF19015.1 hypothetical protein BU204_03970 [Actinophytocola xanthii]
MTRKATTLLSAALVLAASVAGFATRVADRPVSAPAEDDVTVVAEAILAPTGFEQAAARGQAATAAAAAATAPGCRDAAYALAAWRLPAKFSWYYNGAAAPASVRSTALTALRGGTSTLFKAGYRCGGTTTLRTTEVYAGSSTRTAQVNAKGVCTGNDGVSVTSWGSLPATTLAYTCVYYRTSSKTVIASDMLIDNKLHSWFTKLPAGCSNKFDLQAVAVHERGHTAGLGHVDQRTHSSQAMAPKMPPCSTVHRTLGAGDVRGLKAMYGA